ncbi:MAG TPA: hypothetical protein VFR31_17210 [Thermoanaerobaculia bacterium]|nr:hypothetical protein [Thermoanaerobaculia bacterium]
MTRKEYEERLRALEAQHQADIALMNAAHEARVRSLESLWRTVAPLAADPRPVVAVPAPAPAPPAPKLKRERFSVFNDLAEALPGLPEVFDKHDIVSALGYEPSRATLFRALRALGKQGMIATESSSIGGTTSRYRKL